MTRRLLVSVAALLMECSIGCVMAVLASCFCSSGDWLIVRSIESAAGRVISAIDIYQIAMRWCTFPADSLCSYVMICVTGMDVARSGTGCARNNDDSARGSWSATGITHLRRCNIVVHMLRCFVPCLCRVFRSLVLHIGCVMFQQ